MNDKKRIAVVGAGIAGLTCAYELQKAGHDVVVYEKESQVGGRMKTHTKGHLPFDIGANHLCNLYEHMKVYCEELDIAFEPMVFLKYGLYKDGKIEQPYKAINWWTRLRLAIEFFRTSSNNEWLDFYHLTSATSHDKDNAYDYMKRRLGKQGADYLTDPFVTTYQFHGAKEISLGAVKSVLELLKYKREGWYLHQLIGGMSALPEAFAKKLDVHLNTPVANVTGTTVDGKSYDAVVLASTADQTKKIYTDASTGQQKILDETVYANTISIAFEVAKETLPDTSIVWVPRIESNTISGYTNEMMKGGAYIHDGKSLICVWLHEEYAKTLLNKSDEEIFTQTKRELLKFCPWFSQEAELQNYDLYRWEAAMPKFAPGYLTKVKTFLEDHQGENNVFFCGDYLNSPWTEGSLRCGQRVAEAVTLALATEQ